MNTRTLCLITGLLFSLHCLQGPWEYLPDNEPIFRGLTVNAYVISGKPLNNVCIERLYELEEAGTLAFPFYDSAYVTIAGNGGNGEETVVLTPLEDCPVCFEGPDSFTGLRGETYRFRAVIRWDSAGTAATTTITAEATIPSEWSIDSVAKVNKAAIISSGTAPATTNPLLQQLFGNLPEEVISVVSALYLPQIEPIIDDSAALTAYLTENGAQISATIDSLLQDDNLLVPYYSGDTLRYLSGQLNLSAHFFKADYSDDVKGVLVTHSYGEDAVVAFNAFNQIAATFGPLSPSSFYRDATEYRLQYIPVIESEDGENSLKILESIPIVNGYLLGGKNTFYFYGTDKHYADFVRTYIEGHSMSNVIPIHSVNGGQGFFTGMAVDSFTVTITVPSDVQAYTLFEARADYCNNVDWDNKFCRGFEPDYCEEADFNDMQYGFDNPDIVKEPTIRNTCLAEAVAYFLTQGESVNYLEDSFLIDGTTVEFDVREDDGTVKRRSRKYSSGEIERAKKEGLLRYCIRNDFSDTACEECEKESRKGDTPEAEALFTWCEDNLWQGAACEWAAALYCRKADNPPKALCDNGNTWCEEHPEDAVCR